MPEEDDYEEPWHVVPPKDLRKHSLSESCWCRPQYIEESHMILHNCLSDERECATIN